MRPIDADALQKVIEEVYFSDKWLDFRVNYGSNGVRDVILDLVTNAPPIPKEKPSKNKIRHGKTLYKVQIKDKTYCCGDKLLRIVSAILHVIELGFIIYLFMR